MVLIEKTLIHVNPTSCLVLSNEYLASSSSYSVSSHMSAFCLTLLEIITPQKVFIIHNDDLNMC